MSQNPQSKTDKSIIKKLTAIREEFLQNTQPLYEFKADDPRKVIPLSLEFKKKQAKQLLKKLRQSTTDTNWSDINKYHPNATALDVDNIKLSDIQWLIAKRSGFSSWAKLKHHIEASEISTQAIKSGQPSSLDGDKKTLHIRCGNDIMTSLAVAGFTGDFLTFADPYVMGAVPQTETESEFIQIRAEVISNSFEDHENAYEDLSKDYAALYKAVEYERVMFWFEHDAYDVFTFLKLLHFYSNQPQRPAEMHYICITSYPGVKKFNGIGQLPAEAMRVLWEQFQMVTDQQLAWGKQAWQAYTAPDPTQFQQLSYADTPDFPELIPAMQRQLRDLPWLQDGLSLTERLTLQILADKGDKGDMQATELFYKWYVLHYEPLVFLGDAMYWKILDSLATSKHPAILFHKPSNKVVEWKVTLTDFGRALLNHHAHWVKSNGISRWFGGTHNHCGSDKQDCWYWDEAKKNIIRVIDK